MVLFKIEETLEYMEKISKDADEILISSFGIWAGIKPEVVYDFAVVFKFMEKMRKNKNVSILIGKPTLIHCNKTYCMDCVTQNKVAIERINSHAKYWPMFQWFLSDQVHIKAFLVRHKEVWSGIAGSRNLSGSKWKECMFSLDKNDSQLICNEVKSIIRDCTELGEVKEWLEQVQ